MSSACPTCGSADVEYVSAAASAVCNACGSVLASHAAGGSARSSDLVGPEMHFGAVYGLASAVLAGDVRVRAPRLAMPGRRAGERRWVPGQEALRDGAERAALAEQRNMPALVRHLGGVLARCGAPAALLEQAKVLFTQARILGRALRQRVVERAAARGHDASELRRSERALGEARWGMLSEHMATVVAWAVLKKNHRHLDLDQLVVDNGQLRSVARSQLARLKRIFFGTPILNHLNQAEPTAYVPQYLAVLRTLSAAHGGSRKHAAAASVPPAVQKYLASVPDWARAEQLAAGLAKVCEAEGLFKISTGPGARRDAHLTAFALAVAATEGTAKKASPVQELVSRFDLVESLRVQDLDRREQADSARSEEQQGDRAAASESEGSDVESGHDDAATSDGETDFTPGDDVKRREAALQRLREVKRMVTPWMRALPWYDGDTAKHRAAKRGRKKREAAAHSEGDDEMDDEMDPDSVSRADFAAYLADVVAFRDAIATRALQAEHALADQSSAEADAAMDVKLGAVRAQLRAAEEANRSQRIDGWSMRYIEGQRHRDPALRRERVPLQSNESKELAAFHGAFMLEHEAALLVHDDAHLNTAAAERDASRLQLQELHGLASMLDEQASSLAPAGAGSTTALPRFLLLDEQELAAQGTRVASKAAVTHTEAAIDTLLFAPGELEGYFFTSTEREARAEMAERMGLWEEPLRDPQSKPRTELKKRTLEERAQDMGLHVVNGRISKARRVDVDKLFSRSTSVRDEHEEEMEIIEEAGNATPQRYLDTSEEEEEHDEEE